MLPCYTNLYIIQWSPQRTNPYIDVEAIVDREELESEEEGEDWLLEWEFLEEGELLKIRP